MIKKARKNRITLFLAITFLEYLAANFAHPITPTIIKNLNLNDYMFGLAFAGMSFTNFLFSPFWGKLIDYVSASKLLLIGCVGYGCGQLLFSIATTELTVLGARCFSGLFVGAVMVSQLVYIVDESGNDISANLTKLATIQSVAGAFGYLIGGVLGVYSVAVTFRIQVFFLAACGVLYFLLLKSKNEKKQYGPIKINMILKEANPFKSFYASKTFMTKAFAILFLVVLFANLGTNAFDQCFNYYIKDQFGFTSAYNGALKAITGIITLIANITICMYIIRKLNIKKSTGAVLACCATSVIAMLIVENVAVFIIICIIFFTFNSIYIPLLQNCVATEATGKNSNLVMGFYNSIKSLGMIGGALLAGMLYGYSPKVPFVFAGTCFIIAAVFLITDIKIKNGNHH